MSKTAEDFSRVATSREFVDLWRAVVEEPCSYLAFKDMTMPEGFEPKDLWPVFSMLRRNAGVVCSVKPWAIVDDDTSWFYIPKSVADDQQTLMVLANDSSFLGTYLRQHSQTDFSLLSPLFNEVSTLAKRDGIDMEPVEVGRIWVGAQSPKTPEECIIRNLSKLFGDMGRYKTRKLSMMLIQDLHDLLIEGVGELDLPRRTLYSPDIYAMDRVNSPDFAQEMLEAAVELARSNRRFRNPVLICTEIGGVFWDLPVFPSLNCLTELLVRRLFFIQHELSALSYVRFGHFREEFNGKEGLLGRYEQEFHVIREEAGTSQGLDVSLIYISHLEAYLSAARELEEIAHRAAAKRESTMAKLKSLEDINDRQRKILMMALTHPGFSLRIQDFAKAFGVVYSTARNDLEDLAARGFLICEKRGRAFSYRVNRIELKRIGI